MPPPSSVVHAASVDRRPRHLCRAASSLPPPLDSRILARCRHLRSRSRFHDVRVSAYRVLRPPAHHRWRRSPRGWRSTTCGGSSRKRRAPPQSTAGRPRRPLFQPKNCLRPWDGCRLGKVASPAARSAPMRCRGLPARRMKRI
jgi:hypothetical protein